ncbi:hypothetical protein HY992_01440 [Candidatus Micrarchaeota archaeon]|nr:hypothetical protein [Candidatus Micrarchaeota archaeon]
MWTRAQVSLEFLLVFVAFLAALVLVVPAQMSLIETIQAAFHAKQLQLALAGVKNTADALCTLGNNNEKTIEVSTPDAVLSAYNNSLAIISAQQFSFEEQTRCALEQKTISLNGTTSLIIANEKQEVKIRVQ